MAKDDSTDIFMKFCIGSDPIPGESTTDFGDVTGLNKRMLAGFKPQKMFELDSFSFSVGIEDDSSTQTGANGTGAQGGQQGNTQRGAQGQGGQQGHGGQQGTGTGKAKRRPLQFQAWRNGRSQKPYPVSVQPISLTRAVDVGSNLLLQRCIESRSYDSAALIKRKAAGTKAAGECFLRMDFVGVLITDISWSNDEPIKETCKFISRAITVHYRPQLPDGTLGAMKIGFWSMLQGEKEVQL